jgi:hypothetical protein
VIPHSRLTIEGLSQEPLYRCQSKPTFRSI